MAKSTIRVKGGLCEKGAAMSRHIRRRGHIFHRGRKWVVVVYVGQGQVRDRKTGEKKLGPKRLWLTFPSREDAQRALARYQKQKDDGGVIATDRILLRDFLGEWLAGKPNLAPTTRESYRQTITKHLSPALGAWPLRKLQALHVEGYCREKLTAGLSPTTVRYHVMLLHDVLETAVKRELVARNVCDLVDAPARARVERRMWDEEQIRVFLGEAKRSSVYYPLYLTAIMTGLRQGELLGLRWQDVDFTGWITVQQKFYRLGGQQLWGPPKTAKGRRMVPLHPAVLEELRRLREQQAEYRRLQGEDYEDHDLVFCQSNGKPLHGHNVTRRDFRRVMEMRALRKEAKARGVPEDQLPKALPRLRFHDLRHLFATHNLQRGEHLKVVSEILGHAQVSTTLDLYSHVLPGLKAQVIQHLGDRLLGVAEETR